MAMTQQGVVTESVQARRHIASGTGAQPAAIPDLTDNTAGTPGATLVAIPDPADAPGTADILRDDLVANTLPPIRDDIASLNQQMDTVLAALRALGAIAS